MLKFPIVITHEVWLVVCHCCVLTVGTGDLCCARARQPLTPLYFLLSHVSTLRHILYLLTNLARYNRVQCFFHSQTSSASVLVRSLINNKHCLPPSSFVSQCNAALCRTHTINLLLMLHLFTWLQQHIFNTCCDMLMALCLFLWPPHLHFFKPMHGSSKWCMCKQHSRPGFISSYTFITTVHHRVLGTLDLL